MNADDKIEAALGTAIVMIAALFALWGVAALIIDLGVVWGLAVATTMAFIARFVYRQVLAFNRVTGDVCECGHGRRTHEYGSERCIAGGCDCIGYVASGAP